jgi:hypothetical protein
MVETDMLLLVDSKKLTDLLLVGRKLFFVT